MFLDSDIRPNKHPFKIILGQECAKFTDLGRKYLGREPSGTRESSLSL